VVLDDFGARVLVFNPSFEFVSSFQVAIHQGPPRLHEVGLSMDAFGRIYLSNVVPDRVTVYSPAGKVLGVFGHTGYRAEEFKTPSGLWVDTEDRVYVADTDNSRVQVFQTISAGHAVTENSEGNR
jgi:sugar lactone lactonase YvrE